MPPLGECLRQIAPVAAMVTVFVETTLNTTKTQLGYISIASCLWEFHTPKRTLYSAHRCDKLRKNMKRHNSSWWAWNISSYQTFSADKNWKSY
jgi:hypothetical protein